jgi:glycosyltransferase involved in cell wall biosynthesis
MSIAILFDADIKNGGSYQMSINNLLQFKKNFTKANLDFIIFTHKKDATLDKLKINYNIIKLSLFDYIFIFFRNIYLINYLINRSHLVSNFEKKLLKKNISVIIFLFTSYKAFLLRKINFTSVVLDVCHREFQNFPEVRGKVFIVREYLNNKILPLSTLVITESDFLKNLINKFYNIDLNKIIPIPNIPSKLMFYSKKKSSNFVKKKFKTTSDFYFYPAQFWYHKNHAIILEAIKKIKSINKNINFIFCGRDKGNLQYIKNKILEYKINDNVKIYDYVTNEKLLFLYKSCKALIMPTFFGPTNIPPVEAWFLGVPVAYSSYLVNHGKNAALYFDPYSSEELVNVLLKLEISSLRKMLILKGRKRFKQINRENLKGHKLFVKNIKSLIFN